MGIFANYEMLLLPYIRLIKIILCCLVSGSFLWITKLCNLSCADGASYAKIMTYHLPLQILNLGSSLARYL